MEKEVLLTPEGLKKLEDELEHLRTVRRRDVAERIKQAREFGDISENSEYEDAKNEQAFIEGRIATLEKMLRNARVVNEAEQDPSVVNLGSVVRVTDLDNGDTMEYSIVSSMEADPGAAKISIESPVGKALLGQKVDSVVEVLTPGGTLRLKITGITQ